MTFTVEEIFDKIVDEIGRNGLFQRRFSVLFNSALVFFGTIAYFSIYLSLAVPDHWCKVPGRNHTNYTREQWKNLTIPWTDDSSGKKEFSKCEMYNELGNTQSNKTACRHGWEYDDKWFSQTLASKYNWVCDDSIYITNAFTFLAIGDISGSIFFGQMGDLYGRKPVYLMSLLFIIAGRTASIFTPDIYLLFLLALVIGSSSSVSLYQSPLVVLMEISNEEDRSFLTMVQNISYTAGFCIMPLMFWVLRDWTMFSLIAVAPLLGYLFINRFMIESPRWLVDKSRKEECIEELKKIAKINKTTIPKYLIEDLARSELIVEKVYGTMSLFSSWGMTRMTLLVVIQCITFMPVYGILCLNLNNLEGNPFMNYFWQALAEAPGLISAKFACDIIGRRFSRLFGYLVGIIAGAFLIYIVSGGTGNETAVTILSVVLKFSAAFSGYAVYLNSMELFPTCVRQSGLSFGYTMGCLIGLACPYFIYLIRRHFPVTNILISHLKLPSHRNVGLNECQISGWGFHSQNEDEELSKDLFVADVKIVEFEECARMFKEEADVKLTEGMVCAGHENGNTDSCRGDSGGPLVCDGVLVGIISAGIGCGNPLFPGIYTDIHHYMPWIESCTENSVGCKNNNSIMCFLILFVLNMFQVLNKRI